MTTETGEEKASFLLASQPLSSQTTMSNPPNAAENEAQTSEGGPTKQELRAQRKAAKASGKKDKNSGAAGSAAAAPSANKQHNPPSSSSQKPTRDESSKQNQKQSSQQNQNQNQSRPSKPAAARPTTGDSSSAHQNQIQSSSNSNPDSVLTSLPSLFGNVSVASLRTSPSNHLVAGSSRRPKNPNQNPTNLNSYPSSSTTSSSSSSSISIHPSILSLAVQLSTLSLTGANARAIAVLGALSDFIRDYKIPKGMVLSRDLVTKLSPQINHLVEARPLGTSVGNAIRYLKYEISVTKVDWTEEEAKSHLQSRISHFIRDRIEFAGKVIHSNASAKIRDGDVVLTYGRSSVVEGTLLKAWENGRRFSVIVVDGRPALEGKVLLRTLLSHSIPCIYGHLTALGSLISRANLVLLGTASLLANGALYARAGTASCAMMANQRGIPVVVCCETYKFSDRVQLDGFVVNEGADPLALLSTQSIPAQSSSESTTESQQPTVPLSTSILPSLSPSLSLVNLLYDLTPPRYVSAIASEVGLSGPESVGVILRDYKSVLYGV